MTIDPNDSHRPPEPSTPRRVPERRMTQRELVILSLLKRPDDPPAHHGFGAAEV